MEIRVQVGGVTGWARLVNKNSKVEQLSLLDDIHGVLNQVIEQFGSLDKLPYSEIIQSVVQFQGRRRRQR